jgi:catechol 2,3-dioxygenase-like lactoylglutathione lyase family enzyme
MRLNLDQIGQIGLPSSDIERTEAFYGGVLGLRKLYRFGDLTFFDCAGVRLLLEKVEKPEDLVPQGCLYFRCADIALAVAELEKRGLAFDGKPHPDRPHGRPRPLDGVLQGPRRPYAGADAGGAEGVRACGVNG